MMYEWSKRVVNTIAKTECLTGYDLQYVEAALRMWENYDMVLDEILMGKLENRAGFELKYGYKNGKIENYPEDAGCVTIAFPVYCFERELVIKVWPEKEGEVLKVMQEAYDTWVSDEDEVGASCCEEYILERVKRKGFWYKLVEEETENEE